MTEQQYNSAIEIYNPNGGHKAGKIYGLKSNDLTVSGGGGTRFNKAGQLENVAFEDAKIDYSTGKPAFLIEPSRTNIINHSYDLITDTSWTISGGLTATLDQIGITGEPNTGLLLTDGSSSDYGEIVRSLITTSSVMRVSAWIKKDSDQSRFPEFYGSFRSSSDGSTLNTLIHLNTMTGEIVSRAGYTDSNNSSVIDRGEWWELVIISATEVNRISGFTIRPAMSDTFGGSFSSSATGSIIVGHIDISASSVIDVTPIITNGAAVTRTENAFRTESLNCNPNNYSLYLHFLPVLLGERQVIAMGKTGNTTNQLHLGLNANNELILDSWHSSFQDSGILTLASNLSSENEVKVCLVSRDDITYAFVNGSLIGNAGLHTINWMYSNYGSYGIGSFRSKIYTMEFLPSMTDQEAINLTTV